MGPKTRDRALTITSFTIAALTMTSFTIAALTMISFAITILTMTSFTIAIRPKMVDLIVFDLLFKATYTAFIFSVKILFHIIRNLQVLRKTFVSVFAENEFRA